MPVCTGTFRHHRRFTQSSFAPISTASEHTVPSSGGSQDSQAFDFFFPDGVNGLGLSIIESQPWMGAQAYNIYLSNLNIVRKTFKATDLKRLSKTYKVET